MKIANILITILTIFSSQVMIEAKCDESHLFNELNTFSYNGSHRDLINDSSKIISNCKELYNNGQVLLVNGENEEALNKFSEALKICQSFDNPYIESLILDGRGIAFRRLNRYDKAIDSYNMAIEINNGNKDFFYNRGVALLLLSKINEAHKDFLMSMEIAPNNKTSISWAWNNIGVGLYDQRDYKGAIEAFNKSLENDSSLEKPWYNLGLAFFKIGKYEQAIKSYDNAISRNPNYYEAWINKGIAESNLALYGDALLSFRSAAELDTQNPLASTNIGLLLVKLGRYNESVKFFDEAINKFNKTDKNLSSYNTAFLGKGLALSELARYNESDYEEAIKLYEIAIKLNEPHGSIYIMKGNAELKLGRYVEALDSFDKALNVDPRNETEAWNGKGDALHELGIYDEAILAYHKSRELAGKEIIIRDSFLFLFAYCLAIVYLFFGKHKGCIFGSMIVVNILGLIAYSCVLASFFGYETIGLFFEEGLFVIILTVVLWVLFGPVGDWWNRLSLSSWEFELNHKSLSKLTFGSRYIIAIVFAAFALIANSYQFYPFEAGIPNLLRWSLFSIIVISLLFTLPPIILALVSKDLDNTVRNALLILHFCYLGIIALFLSWLFWCYRIPVPGDSVTIWNDSSLDPILMIMACFFVFTFLIPYLAGWRSAKNWKGFLLDMQVRRIDQLSRIARNEDLSQEYSELERLKNNVLNDISNLIEGEKIIQQYAKWDNFSRNPTNNVEIEPIYGMTAKFRELINLDPRFAYWIFLKDIESQILDWMPSKENEEIDDADISKNMNHYIEKELLLKDKIREEFVTLEQTKPQVWIGFVSLVSPILGLILSSLIASMELPVASVDIAKIISDSLLNVGIFG